MPSSLRTSAPSATLGQLPRFESVPLSKVQTRLPVVSTRSAARGAEVGIVRRAPREEDGVALGDGVEDVVERLARRRRGHVAPVGRERPVRRSRRSPRCGARRGRR